ncbi:MAG: hypothetical protein ABSA41_20290 [Terriglobia bacterium]|jgi:hypothetical protein
MRKLTLSFLCFLSIALAMTPPGQGPKPSSAGLAAFMPTGSLLFVESPDFATLVHDWENSQEKQKWLESDNYQVFSRSRLFLRLQEAQRQFAAAAGVPPDMALLDSLAGRQSALALYDIGNLEFLFITRMPSARAMQNVLWTNREKFEPRKAADIPYYVRTEPEKKRLVAFATSGDCLLLATREDLMAGALALLSGKSQPTLQDEDWYKSAVSIAGAAGDLRMVLNLPLLVKSPHFRTYWVQRNITVLKQYSAEVADIHRSATEIREDRVLLKANPPGDTEHRATASSAAIGELLGMVPAQEGIYLAWSAPSADTALDLVQQKVLAPHTGPGVASQIAPGVALTQGQTGSESDLDTRIDIPPLQGATGAVGTEALKKLLNAVPLEAVLEFHSLHHVGQSAFIAPHSAVLIRSSANWDSEAARNALRAAIEDVWTASQIGVNWVENHDGNANYYQLDGLIPLVIATKGPILVVANSAETLRSLLANSQGAEAGRNVVYAAGFRHSAERENIMNMMRLIEMPLAQQYGGVQDQPGRTPSFFSENLASLSQSLESIESESLLVEDRGPQLLQTVTFRLKK